MYLRDLAVWASDAAQMPPGRSPRAFNLSTHTPVEAYLALLPRHKVWLHDIAKLNVAAGPRPPGEYVPREAVFGIALIYWPWFNFARYFQMSRAEQQLRIIEMLHKALLRIARRTGSPTNWYDEAYAALKAQSFPLPEISEYELRRRWVC